MWSLHLIRRNGRFCIENKKKVQNLQKNLGQRLPFSYCLWYTQRTIEPIGVRWEEDTMKCPYCGYKESKVVDSRPADDGSIRRRRECLSCQRRFTTYETVEVVPVVVVKRDGTRQQFERNKVLHSMLRACEKRTVPLAKLELIADEIEQNIQSSGEHELTTDAVAQLVMEKLRGVDEVAYVRFVSVYRQFKDIDTFLQELTKLRESQ